MSKFKTLDGLDVKGKRVVLRADFNVPFNKEGQITDTSRIDRTVPTIQELVKGGASVVIVTHVGRPKGERNPDYTVKPLVAGLSKALGGTSVQFADDCTGDAVESTAKSLKAGEILLCENLRYYKEETKNDAGFAEKLSKLGDLFVNDAFSTAHRAHASTEGITKFLPSYAGRLMQSEVEALSSALEKPQKPVAAVVGGAKVSSKIDVLTNLMEKVDVLVIGGGMANTFLAAQGINVGKSLCEKDFLDTARNIMEKAKKVGCEIVLPTDATVAKEFAENAQNRVCSVNDIKEDEMMLDIGTESAKFVAEKLKTCKTVVWNGPMGAFEIKPFDMGTVAAAKAAAQATKAGTLTSVAGGGDTVSALELAGAKDDFTYISTAGGAFLEWLEGKTLPGVEAVRA